MTRKTLSLIVLGGLVGGITFILTYMSTGASLPGPARAAAAAHRVRPGLERDLRAKGLEFGAPVFLRAFKEEMKLEVFVENPNTKSFELFRSYPVARASGTLGPKLAEGDGQVPEGFYFVPRSAMKPDSRYHLAFNLGYPNSYDRSLGRTGSAIMVHGNRVSAGCLAMTDPKIEEIYTLCDAALKNGQPYFRVHVFPFRMTDQRMKQAAEKHPDHLPFWRNLKEGHDWFEKHKRPPEVGVADGTYTFRAG